jgi:hypothetical protein
MDLHFKKPINYLKEDKSLKKKPDSLTLLIPSLKTIINSSQFYPGLKDPLLTTPIKKCIFLNNKKMILKKSMTGS